MIRKYLRPTLLGVFFGLILYSAVCDAIYRLQHPELTETQRFLHLWRTVTWRD